MVNTKTKTYTMSNKALEKLDSLSEATGLKKSTILTLLVEYCEADDLMKLLTKKVNNK